ncbi:autophagy-related protein 27 [Biscogniauxia mediterranea]|nr:autophagy-related protein 27 [Biscogniauxia mediterranea]
MKFPTIHTADAAVLLSLLLAPLPAAAMFRCNHIVADKQQFNLEPLGGPHSVVMSYIQGDTAFNTTYTVDICRPLKKKGEVPKREQCKNGSRVCAIKRQIELGEKGSDIVQKAIPIAGELEIQGGGALDPEVSRLSVVDPDLGKQGLRVVLKGGYDETTSHVKRKQQAIIDFVCDESRDGSEGEYDPEDKYERSDDPLEARATDPLSFLAAQEGGNDEDDDDAPTKEVQLGIENDPSLVFVSYGAMEGQDNTDVLRLRWSSKHVCASTADDGSDGSDGSGGSDGGRESSAHWGFFTWLVIIVFLGTAAYLIFGSWLNYNRYGARGWDLLPHGDTIRDIPYLLKDWTRRVLNTVQGSGSRGGYSAV